MPLDIKAPAVAPSKAAQAPESLLSRVIVAPVLFVTFILSLFVIDRQTYSTVFSHNKDSDSPSRSKADDSNNGHYHSNRRKLARREIEDAFQFRGKVLAVFVVATAVALAVMGWAGSKLMNVVLGGGSGMPVER